MTQPRLKLDKLVVVRDGHHVYEQNFHDGLNVIHGDNASGKSTIADFIFFVLGGEVQEWKEHASLCSSVLAQVQLNEATVTLQRSVSTKGQRPLSFFFGNTEEAVAHRDEGWHTYPYRRNESATNSESFSQILFRALGIPEASTPEDSNVTMHQVLRLLYSDQLTPVQRIFRFETFDSPTLKETVGDLLCGVGGYELHRLRFQLRDAKQEYSDVSAELKGLLQVASELEEDVNSTGIRKAQEVAENERQEIAKEIENIIASEDVQQEQDDLRRSQHKQRLKIGRDLERLRAKREDLERNQQILKSETDDSLEFVDFLQDSLQAFEISAQVAESFGNVRFAFCPVCFSAIPDDAADPENCHLCKSPIQDATPSSRILAARLDIETQISESLRLVKDRKREVEKSTRAIGSLSRQIASLQATYDSLSRTTLSTRDRHLGELHQRLGHIESDIDGLRRRIETAGRFEVLSGLKADLNHRITEIGDEISAVEARQRKRQSQAYTRIAEHVTQLLHLDGGEKEFAKAASIGFSFRDDILTVNERSNFAASSMVILKNSFQLSLLLSSLEDKRFMLPRFLLFDNLEDKGMTQPRRWAFQEHLAKRSKELLGDVPHQIVCTTSEIAPPLDTPDYVVGRHYTKAAPTLDFS